MGAKLFQDGAVLLERREDIALITLNRPARRNAINMALRRGMVEALEAADQDREARGIVITGAEGHFCGGGDLGEMDQRDVRTVQARMQLGARVIRGIRQASKPCIAAVEGSAFGAGVSIAVACDQVIASSTAKFSAAFVKVGLVPDWGLMHLLPRRIGDGPARRMLMTACMVEIAEALEVGLVDREAEPGDAVAVAIKTAREFSAHAPLPIQLMKRAMGDGRTDTLDGCLSLEADAHAQLFASRDFSEALTAFQEKRPPRFVGL